MKCLKTYQIEKPDEFWFSAKYYHYWYILTQKFRIKSKQTAISQKKYLDLWRPLANKSSHKVITLTLSHLFVGLCSHSLPKII